MESGERIGINVKQARKAAGMSQEQLARVLGVSVFTVSRLERGVGKSVSVRRLIAVAEALGVPFIELLEGAK